MMTQGRDVWMSPQTLRVLEAFDHPAEQLAGAEVQKRTGLGSGTVYPILLRLERAGCLVSRWELLQPALAARPRRRLYRLTLAGFSRASVVIVPSARGALSPNVVP